MKANTIDAYISAGGSAGVRDHVFVLPSVICTTLVAKKVADATGAVTIRHQDGCGHIGTDVGHGLAIYSSLARNPNICATLVLSLGCETLQGSAVVADLQARDVPVELLRLQAQGAAELEKDATAAVHRIRHRRQRERKTAPMSTLRIGILADRQDPAIDDLIGRCLGAGVQVVIAGKESSSLPPGISRVDPAPDGLQRLTTLAAAGASLVVAYPHPKEAPFSMALFPVVNIGASSTLHQALAADFDLTQPDGADVWRLVIETVEGHQTVAESQGLHNFALPRLRRTM